MASFLDIMAALGPALLAVMGVVVTLSPNVARWRFAVIAAFIVVGGLTSYGVWQQGESTKAALKATQDAITGGDNYSYFQADESDLMAYKDKIRLWINSTGYLDQINIWITPFGVADPNDDAYWSIGGGPLGPVYKGNALSGISIRPGKYTIDLNARNGLVVQTLKIFEYQGKLIEITDVFRDGEKLYSTPRPIGMAVGASP